VEARLKRMEEAYLRMEQGNLQLRAEYEALQKRFDDVSQLLHASQAASSLTATARARTVSRSTPSAPEPNSISATQEPRLDRDISGVPTRVQPRAPSPSGSGVGAEGIQRRGEEAGGRAMELESAPSPATESRMELISGGSRMDRAGAGAEGTGGRTSPEQQPSPAAAAREGKESWVYKPDVGPPAHASKVRFAEGLEFISDDEEFRLQFHNLTQLDFRGFPKADQGILQSQFALIRQRWYFTGELTKDIGFYTLIDRGYGSLDILDAFMWFRLSEDRLRFRIGRMKTPYLYEYFSIAEGDLIAPERSIYANNMGLNRQIGAMFLGNVVDDRVSYAVGVFNGPRRSFQDFNSAKDLIGTVTARPFLKWEDYPALRYINIGGSFDAGYQNNTTTQPQYLETANDQTSATNALSLSPAFLAFNKNVIELGERCQWGAHVVWFYKSFFFLAEYGGGRAGYGFLNQKISTPINYDGYTVQASYFLTGEELTRRVSVAQPRRDFNFAWLQHKGEFAPGAIEVHARYCTLDFGRNVFTGGFADPNLWSNHVWATDIGLNWYLNFYTKIMLDWQHAGFGNPVVLGPYKFGPSTDLFWLRFQLFF
jgi:phosphate-selective porin OprO/OprP